MTEFDGIRRDMGMVAELARYIWKDAPRVSDLSSMEVSEISLVDAPANPACQVVLSKSERMHGLSPLARLARLEALMARLARRVDDLGRSTRR